MQFHSGYIILSVHHPIDSSFLLHILFCHGSISHISNKSSSWFLLSFHNRSQIKFLQFLLTHSRPHIMNIKARTRLLSQNFGNRINTGLISCICNPLHICLWTFAQYFLILLLMPIILYVLPHSLVFLHILFMSITWEFDHFSIWYLICKHRSIWFA